MRIRILITSLAVAASAVLVAPSAANADPSLSYVPDPAWWGTNGRVTDIVVQGSRVYIAGGFDYVGPATGHGVPVDATTGVKPGSTALVDGPVYAAAADGSGGWYIAGDFQHAGGQFRRGAARVDASGQVTAWNPKPDGVVRALAVTGSQVLLGGDFTVLGTTPVAANRLGSVDLDKGQPTPGFTGNADGTVRALLALGGAVYAAGDFTSIAGVAHAGLARLTPTGTVDASFTGRVTGSVRALTASPDRSTLYVGGDLSSVSSGGGATARSRLAAFNASTGAVLAWSPAANGPVNALATDPTSGTVYAGGAFTAVAGSARPYLAAVGPAGAVTSFNAALAGCSTPHVTNYAHSNPPCTPEVDSLAVAGGRLYVGGRFGRSGVVTRHDAAAFAVATGALTSWDAVASDRVLALAPSGSAVFLGGELTSVGGLVRHGVAALDASTGQGVSSFAAETDDEVLDLQPSADGPQLYLAGHFVTVGGVTRKHIALVSAATGAVNKAFKANANNDVLSLGLAAGRLYATGQFTKINGVARKHAVKLAPATGAVDAVFKADTVGPKGTLQAGGMVQSMVVSPDATKVYLAGPFQTVNGTSRPGGLAVVNGTTGALLANQLGGVQGCQGLGPWMVKLYLSPDGTRLWGGDVCPDFIYQWDAVNLSTAAHPQGLLMQTWCNGGMQGVLEVNGSVYFGSHGGDRGNGGACWDTPAGASYVDRQRFVVFSAEDGHVLPDAPDFDTPMGIWSFAAMPQGLLVGGDFTFAGSSDQTHQGLAYFHGTP
jgi:hypothetical protein